MKAICDDRLKLEGEVWNGLSRQVKDLLRKMLDKNPKRRPAAREAVTHKWFSQYRSQFSPELRMQALSSLRTFNAKLKVEKALYSFLSYHVLMERECDELAKVFGSLDLDNDGKLSREELLRAYDLEDLDVTNIDEIMQQCDTDHSGFIEFTEFVMATQNWHKLLQRELIQKLFTTIESGTLDEVSAEELQIKIPGVSASEWQHFFCDADTDQNGKLSIDELVAYLKTKLEGSECSAKV